MKLYFITICFLITLSALNAQNSDDIIAKIGDKAITVEEFKYRYELTPQVNRMYFDETESREELLYTLIAENLLAAEAENLGMDTLKSFQNSFFPLEKMYVRDALYKEMISDSVKLNMKKFNEGLNRANYKLFVDYIFSNDEQSIDKAYKLLNSHPNFDSLVTLLEDAEYVSEPYEVNYGKMYYQAEDAIYNLEMKEFTQPIKSPDGWYIFRLVGQIPVTFSGNDQRNSRVKEVVEQRVEDSIYNEFWTAFFKEKKITTDGSLFWYLVEEMHELVVSIKNESDVKDGEKIVVTNSHFAELKNSIHPDSLKKSFIRFESRPVNLETFLNDFIYEGFYTFSTDIETIASQLNSRVKRQIELELLAREGYQKGLQALPDVKMFTDIWKENYLSTLYRQNIIRNTDISDSEIATYLKESGNSEIIEDQVNILEILTDSLEIIKQALDLSNDEEELRDFIAKHTKRDWVKKNNGEFGYYPVSEYGEIGKIASNMEVGDVYGPLQIENGYSLFKVIGKKQDSLSIEIDDIDPDLNLKIKYEKLKNDLEELTAELAEKYNVTINKSLLNSLDLLNSQMVVFRYMGFGGRILAFPYSSPNFEWKTKWEQKKKDVL